MRIHKLTHFLYFLLTVSGVLTTSCGVGDTSGRLSSSGDTILMQYARNIVMTDHGHYLRADFRNPWDTTHTLHTYILVPADKDLPSDLPKGTVIRTPLQKSIVYTGVHSSLIHELGALDAIAGVCDAKYIIDDTVRSRVVSGRIADCGSSMAPVVEKILMLKPDAILLSAYEDSGDHNKVAATGVPIIDCTDYMESSPLARAEWIRFYGRLYGKGEMADSMFSDTEKSYLDLKATASTTESRPLVLTELIYGQTWDVPGALSTVGVLLTDAGATNPFASYMRSGSVRLSPEEVLYKAAKADYWFVKYTEESPLTLDILGRNNDIYKKFDAYKSGNVYGCNTSHSTYFDDLAFHPDRVLAEYVNILHPGLIDNSGTSYYQKLKP